jgi:AcrR family transcriptional regulator
MTRPSHNIDVLLFEKGQELLLEVGFDKFSVRNLCKKAGVNFGMFHYYFKTKENFIELLIEQVFEQYLDEQKEAAKKYAKAIDKLRAVMRQRALTGLKNKRLLFMFFKEFINRSFDKIIKRHRKEELKFLVPIIEQCKKDKDISRDLEAKYILPLLIPTVNFAVATELFKTERIDEDGTIVNSGKADFTNYVNNLIDIIFRGLK